MMPKKYGLAPYATWRCSYYMQTTFDDLTPDQEEYILEADLERHRNKNPERTLSELVRNINYMQTINDDNTQIQRNIIDRLINEHPEGITDIEICIATGISRSSVNARRNEIDDVVAVSIAKYTDEHGHDRINTLWGKKCL